MDTKAIPLLTTGPVDMAPSIELVLLPRPHLVIRNRLVVLGTVPHKSLTSLRAMVDAALESDFAEVRREV